MQHSKTLIVIGGGAAGFFCAVNAARLSPGLRVILLEKSAKFLSKVKVSGGGRCNVTHACFEPDELVKKYPRGGHFLKKIFHHFSPSHTIQWFEERGVPLKTEADGRMFPVSNSSQSIIHCLLTEADKYKVETRLHESVIQIRVIDGGSFSQGTHAFEVEVQDGKIFTADFVCIASGGFPREEMFSWIKTLGHEIIPPVPSLFTFNSPGNPITKLMGVSVQRAIVKIEGSKLSEEGPVLITHWGLSGPAILRLSAWGARLLAEKQYKFRILVNWVPGHSEQSLKNEWQQNRKALGGQLIGSRNAFGLPQRLWEYFLCTANILPNTRWAEINAKQQNDLTRLLCAQPLDISGKTTFKEEFVTAGGISTSGVDPQTMQSRKVPNLFFAGEILDIDGITGGFNFQHAWASGFLAARAIASLSL